MAELSRPPRLIGGDEPETVAKGGDDTELTSLFQQYEYFQHYVTDTSGRLIEVPLRRGRQDAAFIDQLTFTIHEDTMPIVAGCPLISDNEYIVKYSEVLFDIFGFGVTQKLPFKGKFFYKSCYQLGPDNAEYGKLHYGGQRETMLIELNGTGCQAATEGWEQRLHQFLKQAVRPRITRCDVAHDFFNGEYSPLQAMTDHDKGLFDVKNMRPKSECRGAAWRNEDGSGKTFYVGRRGSSKLVRIYEKGKQLGDKESPWVRFEIEFRSADSLIPLDMLMQPGAYLTGAYPVGDRILGTESLRIEAKKNTVQLTLEQRVYHGKNQIGRLMNFLLDSGHEPETVCQMLRADDGKYPKGLMPEQYSATDAQEWYLHQYIVPQQDDFGMVDLAKEYPPLPVVEVEGLRQKLQIGQQPAFMPVSNDLQHFLDIEDEERQRHAEWSRHLTPAYLLNPKRNQS